MSNQIIEICFFSNVIIFTVKVKIIKFKKFSASKIPCENVYQIKRAKLSLIRLNKVFNSCRGSNSICEK